MYILANSKVKKKKEKKKEKEKRKERKLGPYLKREKSPRSPKKKNPSNCFWCPSE